MPTSTNTTLQLASLLLQYEEGFRPTPYRCPTGHLTIGFGQRLDTLRLTRAVAIELLTDEVVRIDKWLDRMYPTWYYGLSEGRRATLISIVYQVGTEGFVKFTKMIAALSRGDFNAAADQALDSLAHKQTPQRWERNAVALRTGVIDHSDTRLALE